MTKQHWENIYTHKNANKLSWFQDVPAISLKIIGTISTIDSHVIDVGAGASSLIDNLLKLGYYKLSVLDISNTAIDLIKERLSKHASKIKFYVEDITKFKSPDKYDLWHDRAVFHFLTEEKARKDYINNVKNLLNPGGHVLIATFAKNGPERCSGLDIVQYDNISIQEEMGKQFRLIHSEPYTHMTPTGSNQEFMYFVFKVVHK